MLRPARRPSLPVAFSLVAAFVACGYQTTLGPQPSAAGRAARAQVQGAAPQTERARVMLIALRSDSPEPWLDRIVTDALRRELDARGRIALIDDPKRAQMRVSGRIRPLNTTSRSFSSVVAALEFSVTLALDLEIELERGEVVHLDPAMLSETEAYLASPDIEITRTNRLEVLRRLSDLLAVRVADTIELIDRPMPGGELPGEESPTPTPAGSEKAGG